MKKLKGNMEKALFKAILVLVEEILRQAIREEGSAKRYDLIQLAHKEISEWLELLTNSKA